MSPSEMYEAGGGNLAEANPFLQALMREADKSHHEQRSRPSGRLERPEIPKPRKLDRTEPATLTQYLLWLDGYIKQGGHPTHYYDYPFTGFVYALSDVMVDSDAEYGSQSRSIIVPRGRNIARTDPHAYFNGWGHTNLFLMDGYRATDLWVPVFSNPDFETLLTDEHREERARQDHERRRSLGEHRRSHGGETPAGADDAALRMLGGATFAPGASLTLPSGQTLAGDEAQAFTSLYAEDEDQP